MRTVHQLLCLAKSWKNGGFCIAGKNDDNQWVRTITATLVITPYSIMEMPSNPRFFPSNNH
jgi:hypothetical protein